MEYYPETGALVDPERLPPPKGNGFAAHAFNEMASASAFSTEPLKTDSKSNPLSCCFAPVSTNLSTVKGGGKGGKKRQSITGKGGKKGAVFAGENVEDEEYELESHAKSRAEADQIIASASKSTLFAELKKSQLEAVADAMFKVQATPGQAIIRQGELGDNFYVVQSGEYDVFLSGNPNPVNHYEAGAFFGDLALMYDAPRAATITCKSAGSLWALDRRAFRLIVVRRNHTEMGEHSKFLSSIEMLSVLTNEQREAIGTILEEATFKQGEYLMKQGDPAEEVFFLKEGEVSAWRSRTGQGLGEEVARMNAGAVIGESALKGEKEKRAASIRAEAKVVTMRLGREDFMDMVGDLSELAKTNFKNRIINSIEMFQLLEKEEQTMLLDSLVEKEFKRGEMIIQQADPGDSMYIIMEGTVTVTQETEDGKIVTIQDELGPGSYFGEMALINNAPRMATVSATSALMTMMLDRKTFTQVLGPIKDILERETQRREKEIERSKREPIRYEDLTIENILGVGTFGRVKLAVHKKTFRPYALKCMRKGQIIGLKQVEHVINEKRVMTLLDHPFILALESFYQDHNEIYMLLELALGGELFSALRDQGKFDEDAARFYGACVASGFAFMHDRKIIYRDLKPENLLFDPDGYIKMIDFGFAKIVTNRTFTLCGTNEYLAPEIIQHKGHSHPVDWWAFGILIFEMMTGQPPFVAEDPMEIYKKIINAKHRLPWFFPKKCRNIIGDLLTKNPIKRLGSFRGGAIDIKQHDWFDEIDYGDLEDKAIPPPYLPIIDNPTDTSNFDSYEEEPGEVWAHYLTEKTDRFFDAYGARLKQETVHSRGSHR